MLIPTILSTDDPVALREAVLVLKVIAREWRDEQLGAVAAQILTAIEEKLVSEETTRGGLVIRATQLAAFAKSLTGIVLVNGKENFTMVVEKDNLNITQP